MTWQLITLITALTGLFLAFAMWQRGYIRGVQWTTKYLIDDLEDLDEMIKDYITDNIPPDVKARLAELRGEGKPKRQSVKEETMAEIRKAQANNGKTERALDKS